MLSGEISVILPTKDHEKFIYENIENILFFCEENFTEFEILIISNGSSDENMQLINNIEGSNIKHFKYTQSGKGFAVKKGLMNSKFKYSLICDSDFSVEISNLKNFFINEESLSSFVIGSRKLKDSKVESTPIRRIISGGIFTFLTKNYLDIRVSDTQCGFKLIDNSKFKNAVNFTSNNFFYDIELFLLAKQSNISVIEVPVTYTHNKESSIRLFSDSVSMLKQIFTINRIYK
ncbi:glycosyltransferase [Acidimicrobiia bacterium]|nr:glycosyltransferase [Acidimicrobiia bacterium]